VPTRGVPERISIPYAEPLKLECVHFLDCVTKGKQALTDGEEGLRVLKVLNAAERSLNENESKINLRKNTASPEQNTASYYVHPSSQIDDGVEIGNGTKIWHYSHVIYGSKIGENCSIGQNVVIGPDTTIGKGCKIQNNVSVYKGIMLEDYVFCGPSAVFTNVINPRAEIGRMSEIKPTLVKKGATLGANCTVVCGHTIGSYAFIAAGAVVTKDVPNHALMFGNPARQKGWMCQCGNKLNSKFNCSECGKKYKRKAEQGLQNIK
jgi:UDP-2-acetamido-3-amino-2,3-dideoxy-glucuronate N-acetyltransferase